MLSLRFHRSSFRRGGFTLVEVLIVMVIIAILAGLAYGLLGTAGTQARVERTRVLLKRLDELVKEKLDAIENDRSFAVRLSTFRTHVSLYDSMSAGAGIKAYEVLTKKALQRRALPVRSLDLTGWDSSGMSDTWDDSPVKTTGGINSIASAEDQAAALFFALCPDGKVPDGISPDMVATAGTGKMMFVDGWGQPIRFYLWPTRLVYGGAPSVPANTSYATSLITGLPDPNDRIFKADSADVSGQIKSLSYVVGGGMPPGTAIDANSLHDVGAYSMFLLVSAGPDRSLGLYEPADGDSTFWYLGAVNTGKLADLTDNITNRQGR